MSVDYNKSLFTWLHIFIVVTYFLARQIIDTMGGMSFNLLQPDPDFDLTDRLIDLWKFKSYPLFTMSAVFHRYKTNMFLFQLGAVEAPLLFSRKESVQVKGKL